MRRKICVVVTARPSYSRVKSALRAIEANPELELQLVVAASALLDRYGSVVHQIESDGFRIASRVYNVLEGENLVTMAKSTGMGLVEMATVLDNLRSDLVVTIADRYETIATAIAGAYMNIPVVHIQGGEVTGSIDEKVRHAVTKLSSLHLVASERAAERVKRMGEDPATVHVTGCPSIDEAAAILEDPSLDFVPSARYGGVGPEIEVRPGGYLVVLQHPVTTEYQSARHDAMEALFAIRDYGLPTLWFWPNPDAGSDGTSNAIRAFREKHRPANIRFFKNMAPRDFLRVIYNSRCLIGNSSVGIREASFLGIPVVNIGSRQAGRERGRNVIDVATHERGAIITAIEQHPRDRRYETEHIYGDGRAGVKIARILATAHPSIEKMLTY
jgi:bifunctional UDP-N-acetylglucosamine 2-epimerase / N-acetylmannosamine kinase